LAQQFINFDFVVFVVAMIRRQISVRENF
jgi:hypothetical protein